MPQRILRVGTCRSLLLAAVITGSVAAQPEPWRHPDGTIHYYHAVHAPQGSTWPAAAESAYARGGYLATVTSRAENDFIFDLVDSARYWYARPGGALTGPWLGGYQTPGGPEPDSGWRWITDEPFDWRNWSSGQPDDSAGGEDALCLGPGSGSGVPTWDDLGDTTSLVRGHVNELSAAASTIGLIHFDSLASAGYTLFSPLPSRRTYLVDNKGRLVHTWQSDYRTAGAIYLLENGNLAHTCFPVEPHFPATGGRVEVLDWDSNPIWGLDYADTNYSQDHDAIWLPNGNVLMLAYERKIRDEAIAAGRDPASLAEGELWPCFLAEVNPASNRIVWEWYLWDHLVQDFDSTRANYGTVADHPELADVNFTAVGVSPVVADWIHANAVAYHPGFDQVMISTRHFCEVWVIDHSTTTEQARGHTGGRYGRGGDILYRWGNPMAYRAGDSMSQRLFGQHTAHWIGTGLPGAGHVLLFNNLLVDAQGEHSTVDEFVPDCDSLGRYRTPEPGTPYRPENACWRFAATPRNTLFAPIYSGAQRLPNGNTLICAGTMGRFIEVTRDSQIVWRYIDPVADTVRLYQGNPGTGSDVYRATRYAPDYPGLAGQDLTPGYPLERYRGRRLAVHEPPARPALPGPWLRVRPNPFRDYATIEYSLPTAGRVELGIYSSDGRLVHRLCASAQGAGTHQVAWATPERGGLAHNAVYFARLVSGGLSRTEKLTRLE